MEAAAPPLAPARHSSLRPGATLGRYQLISELGRGGTGVVFLARDIRLGRYIAIKFLSHDSEAKIRRFHAEAQMTAHCEHDNVVHIYDIGEVMGYPYMALEYIEGISLKEWIEVSRAPVSASQALTLMMPVVRALVHIHSLGLVHRDLKPSNIMLARDGAVKIVDFGIAKLLDDRAPSPTCDLERMEPWDERGYQTRTGALVGTLPYMSPEQWGAGPLDERSDIWAVGILLWELVCGRHPLAPLTRERLELVPRLDIQLPSVTDQRADLGQLGSIIDRCLRKRPAERIPRARLLLEELEALPPMANSLDFTITGADRYYGGSAGVGLVNAMCAGPAPSL